MLADLTPNMQRWLGHGVLTDACWHLRQERVGYESPEQTKIRGWVLEAMAILEDCRRLVWKELE